MNTLTMRTLKGEEERKKKKKCEREKKKEKEKRKSVEETSKMEGDKR